MIHPPPSRSEMWTRATFFADYITSALFAILNPCYLCIRKLLHHLTQSCPTTSRNNSTSLTVIFPSSTDFCIMNSFKRLPDETHPPSSLTPFFPSHYLAMSKQPFFTKWWKDFAAIIITFRLKVHNPNQGLVVFWGGRCWRSLGDRHHKHGLIGIFTPEKWHDYFMTTVPLITVPRFLHSPHTPLLAWY